MFQNVAGDIFTFKTEVCFSLLKDFTGFNFTSFAGNWFIEVGRSAAGTFVSISKKGSAYSTVHSARSDKQTPV
jgi:hypothetical protein